jgi:hypothetical protein
MTIQPLIPVERIQRAICRWRGEKVMLDADLAALCGVTTGNLNKAVKHNVRRFPADFMFELTPEEAENWRFQIGISSSYGGPAVSAPCLYRTGCGHAFHEPCIQWHGCVRQHADFVWAALCRGLPRTPVDARQRVPTGLRVPMRDSIIVGALQEPHHPPPGGTACCGPACVSIPKTEKKRATSGRQHAVPPKNGSWSPFMRFFPKRGVPRTPSLTESATRSIAMNRNHDPLPYPTSPDVPRSGFE